LQPVSTGARLFGNGQDGNITITPIVFVIAEPGGTALFAAAWAARGGLRLRRRERSRIGICTRGISFAARRARGLLPLDMRSHRGARELRPASCHPLLDSRGVPFPRDPFERILCSRGKRM
jgi:hypothetical protein